MTPTGLNNTPTYNAIQANSQASQSTHPLNAAQTQVINGSGLVPAVNTAAANLPMESNQVVISEEGKALLSEEAELNTQLKPVAPEKPSEITSFAYGALGLEDPEKVVVEQENSSYTAGKYLKGALTIGTILLAVV